MGDKELKMSVSTRNLGNPVRKNIPLVLGGHP